MSLSPHYDNSKNMKKILILPILFFCILAKAQLFDPNPKEKFNKGDFSFSIIGLPTIMINNGDYDSDSISRPKGGDIGGIITYFPFNRFSISFGVTYKQINSSIAGKLIVKTKAFILNPYFSYFPFESKKISVDVGWFYSNYIQEIFITSVLNKEKLNGINYGLTYQHVFKKNLGVLNNHLGFQLFFHRIFTLKRIEDVKFPFLLNMKIGLIYHV